MRLDDIKLGLKVRVHTCGSTSGFFIAEKNLEARREGAEGIVRGWVPGHGGDVWWIEHTDRPDREVEIGAYMFTEFEPVEPSEPLPEPETSADPEDIFD